MNKILGFLLGILIAIIILGLLKYIFVEKKFNFQLESREIYFSGGVINLNK